MSNSDSPHPDSPHPGSPRPGSSPRYGTALWLSAAAIVVSLAATTVLIARVPALPADAIPLLYAAATATVPILIVCAILTLLRPVMRATVTTRIVVGAISGLGFVLLGIALASWSSGFDAADAGTEQGTFAELFLVWAGGAIVLEWVAATLIGYLLGRQPVNRGARWLVSASAGVVIAVFAIIGAANPVSQLIVACAMLLLPVLLRRSASSTQKEQRKQREQTEQSEWSEQTATPSPHRWERARRQARVLAGGSLVCTLAIWGGALLASIRFRGTDAATTVLTGAGGASQLAAIPLIGRAQSFSLRGIRTRTGCSGVPRPSPLHSSQ
jgi:MFS family permease